MTLTSVVHPALKGKSKFTYSIRFRDLNAAQAWGIDSPCDFDALPKNSRLDIIAWYEGSWRIKAIQAWDEAEERKREYERNKGK